MEEKFPVKAVAGKEERTEFHHFQRPIKPGDKNLHVIHLSRSSAQHGSLLNICHSRYHPRVHKVFKGGVEHVRVSVVPSMFVITAFY